jgi:hypothetical protein
MNQPNRKVKKMDYEVTKDIYEYWKDSWLMNLYSRTVIGILKKI